MTGSFTIVTIGPVLTNSDCLHALQAIILRETQEKYCSQRGDSLGFHGLCSQRGDSLGFHGLYILQSLSFLCIELELLSKDHLAHACKGDSS